MSSQPLLSGSRPNASYTDDNNGTHDTSNTYDQEQPSDTEQDEELEGSTLYEKKAELVNRDLDQMGMGRYQWCIFFLCGFGYMLDLLWAQAFGLIVPLMQQEFGFGAAEYGTIFSAFSAGLTVGAFVWGFLVDIVGRYWAFNFTVLWSSIFGLVLGLPNTYTGVIVLAAFLGVGIGGNVPIDTTICLECLPQNRRWLLPALSVFQPIGVVVCCLICLALIPSYSCAPDLQACTDASLDLGVACCRKADNWGWRYVLFTLGGITLAVFVARYLFHFQESPKFLLYRGNDKQAVESLQFIAKFNDRKSKVTLKKFSALSDDKSLSTSAHGGDSQDMSGSESKKKGPGMKSKAGKELERYKMFFATSTMVRLTILLWIIYAFDYWGFQIAGSFLPKILQQKGKQLGLTRQQTYRDYVFIYLFGIPGVIFGATVFGWRRVSMLVTSACFAASLFVFTIVRSEATYVGINGLVYFFQSMFNGILYGVTPEFFPAPIRGTASGVASFWGRIFSIVAPLVAAQVFAKSTDGVLYLAGSGVFVCTICILFLPSQSKINRHH